MQLIFMGGLDLQDKDIKFMEKSLPFGSLTLYPIRICSKALQQAYFFVKFSK